MFKVILRQRQIRRLVGSHAARIFPQAAWTQLSPSFVLEESQRPTHYALELSSICRGKEPGLTQDHGHAWVRLVEPNGAVYSVGFYPDESTNIEPDELPGLRMPGMLLSPDKYEKHYKKGWHCRTLRYPICEQRFKDTKAFIENLQAKRLNGSLAFDLCEYNCVYFVMRIAQTCNIHINAQTSLLQLADDIYLRRSLQCLRHFLYRCTPKVVAAFIHRSFTRFRSILFNLALGSFGGFSTVSTQWSHTNNGEALKQEIEELSPVFHSRIDLLSKHVPFYHVREFRKWQLQASGAELMEYNNEKT